MSESRIVDPEPQQGSQDIPSSRFEGQTVGEQRIDPAEYQSVLEERDSLKKKLGQQGNEIGELRRAVEQFTVQQRQPEPEPIDFLDDPAAATQQQIDPIRRELDELKTANLQAQLRAKHADFQEIVATPEFVEWVQADPLRKMGYNAANGGDLDIADRLLSEFKEQRQQGGTPQQASQRQQRASAGNGERATGRTPMPQMYSRRELQNLRATNPQRYQELLPDIKRAYQEGRIRE